MAEIMPHLLQREALQYQIIVHLHRIFRYIDGWSACKLTLPIALSCRPGLQATHLRALLFVKYIFPTEMHIFVSNNINTISTIALN